MIEKIAKKICVDSGTILISDPIFYKKWNGCINDRKNLFKTYKVKNGKYNVHWSIKNTWNGDVCGTGTLEITNGKMIVSDPCYHFNHHSDWMHLLENTNYLRGNIGESIILDKMGGDGFWTVRIEMEEK